MCKDTLAALEPDAQTAKRAAYEAFEFDLEAPGLVRVTNGSYGDDAENHSYLVNVEGGVPSACECKAFEYGNGKACKHMTAVAIREPVLEAARTPEINAKTPDSMGQQVVATDGGLLVEANPEPTPEAGCFNDGVEIDHRNVPVEATVPRFFGLEPDVFLEVCKQMNRDIANAAARDTIEMEAGR